jgi:hypothetical protein
MFNTVKKYFLPHQNNGHIPKLLNKSSLTVMFGLVIILFISSLGSSYIVNKTDFGASVLPAVLVDLTNEHRLSNNGKALKINPVLEQAALLKAKDMADNSYFAHTSPTGVTPWQWFSKAGYPFVYAGENLAINFSESVDVQQAWINSPTHNANLISNTFDETGIATYQGLYQGKETTFVVQFFGKTLKKQNKEIAQAKEAKIATIPEIKEEVQNNLSLPEVKGESIRRIVQAPVVIKTEPAIVLILDEPTLVIAKNIELVENTIDSDIQDTVPKYSSLVERILVNHSKNVQYLYLVFIILIYIALLFMIVVEFQIQHIKNIALAVLLLGFLGVLVYINSSFVLSFL